MSGFFGAVNRESPAVGGFEITPDDDNDLPNLARFLIVETEGTIAVVTSNGDEITIPAYRS